MSRRQSRQPAPASQRPEPTDALRQALARQRKVDLVNLLLELAQANRRTLRQLSARLDVTAAADALLAATRQAIAEATAFNPRDSNRNFAYDDEAYREVKRNLARLITMGQLRLAMELALELMKRGSHQVEMSDEGLMSEDIEDCLSVVLQALIHVPTGCVSFLLAGGLESCHLGRTNETASPGTCIRTCAVPANEVMAWCSAMLANDRVGFIAQESLQSLRTHFQAAATE
jgi:hypothetical protein